LFFYIGYTLAELFSGKIKSMCLISSKLRVDYEQVSNKVQIQDNLGSGLDIRFDLDKIGSKTDIMNVIKDNEPTLAKALGASKKSSGPWTELINRVWTAVQRVKGN
jgi:hypothetical protein